MESTPRLNGISVESMECLSEDALSTAKEFCHIMQRALDCTTCLILQYSDTA